MTLCDIVREKAGVLGPTNPGVITQDDFYPSQQIYDAVNASLIMVWIWAQHDVGVGPLLIHEGEELVEVPLHAIMIPKYIEAMEGSMVPSSYGDMARHSLGWRNHQASQPTSIVMFGRDRIIPYPLSNKEYVYDVVGVGWPPHVEAGQEDVEIDDVLKDAVSAQAAAILVEDLYPNLSDQLEVDAQESIKRFMRTQRKQGRTPLTLKPASINRHGRVRGERFYGEGF